MPRYLIVNTFDIHVFNYVITYDWEDEDGIPRTSYIRSWLGRRLRNGLRYAFAGVAILAAWNFIAPAAGLPSFAPYMEYLPSIIAPTENRTAIVNATHVVVLAIAAFLATRV